MSGEIVTSEYYIVEQWAYDSGPVEAEARGMMITHRIMMEFGSGQLRSMVEIFSGTAQECTDEFSALPLADETPRGYEGTVPFKERSWIEEIKPDDDPRWP